MFFGLLVVATGLGLILWKAVTLRQTDARHAAAVFEGVLRVERVIASRRFHTTLFRGGGFGCTYAVVELSGSAPADPPAPSRVRDGLHAFGGDWRPTPFTALVDPAWDGPWRLCEIALGEDLWAQIAEAAAAAGGWVASTPVNGLSIHAPDKGLAALVRVGD